MSDPSTYEELLAEIKKEAWAAVDAIEHEDLIGCRQSADRIKSYSVKAWQTFRNEIGENPQ